MEPLTVLLGEGQAGPACFVGAVLIAGLAQCLRQEEVVERGVGHAAGASERADRCADRFRSRRASPVQACTHPSTLRVCGSICAKACSAR